eukprot:GDKH01001492.1.p2 GENE.GDKH01001492.1~~GDKH01001492.1.p2  ORF type:complete len:118 (-),score=5.84 GDKH01001492.1:683-1036(-)
MGRVFLRWIESPSGTYRCNSCHAHLADIVDLVSKDFHGTLGKAYLFASCVNVACLPAEERVLVTGMHTVCDICCVNCKTIVGWKYLKAFEPDQKYKEGKVILEKARMYKEDGSQCHG